MLQLLRTRPRPVPRWETSGPAVLMIGHVAPGSRARSGVLSVSALRAILGTLRERGRAIVPLAELASHAARLTALDGSAGRLRRTPGPAPVAVGVEGGCRCQQEIVLPLLQALHLPHTLFIDPNRLGARDHVAIAQIPVLLREGTTIGGLWAGRAPLESMGMDEATWNLELMAHGLRSVTGAPQESAGTFWLDLPQGRGGELVTTLARLAGFEGVVDGGRVAGSLRLPRRALLPPSSGRPFWYRRGRVFQGDCPGSR